MTDELLQPFLAKFDEKDTDKKGAIKIDQFKALFPEIMGGNASKESAEMYFRGIDINKNGTVSRKEFSNFVTAAINKDQNYMIQLAFRSFDKDGSQNLNCAEVKAIAKYVGRDMTDDEVEAAMESYTGSKNGSLTYAQVYKMITGKDLEINVATDSLSTRNAGPTKLGEIIKPPGSTQASGSTNPSGSTQAAGSSKPAGSTNSDKSTVNAPASRTNASARPAPPATSSSSAPASSAAEDTKKKSSCCLLI